MKAKTKVKAKTPAKISKTKAAAPAAVSKPAAAAPAAPPALAKTKASAAAPALMGRAVALEKAGDLTGPFELTPAARAAGAPGALRLKEGSARWNIMAYAYAHPKAKLDRDDLERIAGAQLGQALSGLVRYRFLARA